MSLESYRLHLIDLKVLSQSYAPLIMFSHNICYIMEYSMCLQHTMDAVNVKVHGIN